MNTLGKISWLVSLLAISSVTACGSDDDGGGDGGGGALDSGVDADKSGEDLTSDEIESICEAGAEYTQDKLTSSSTRTALCRFAGVMAAITLGGDAEAMQSMCEMTYEACTDCIDDPDGPGCDELDPGAGEEPECGDEEVPSDCSSTVGEIEACFKASIDQSIAMFSDVPGCDELSEDTEPPDMAEEPESPEVCKTVEENCPEALE